MSEPSPLNLALSVGDRVVYPNQGVCRVTAIAVKEVAGQKLTFVTMRREEDGAVVMVPQAKVVTIGLRKVATEENVRSLFEFLKSDSDKANLDWKQRARTNADRMAQGGIHGLAEVVKGLQVLSELRPLPTKERELYDNARHLLVSEISASLNVSECDAEDSIDVVLFPPGRERPKRTAEEFRPTGSDEDLELSPDLMELGEGLDLPPEEEAPPPEEEAPPPEEEAPRDEDEEITKTATRAARPSAAEEEDEEAEAAPPASTEAPVKRKRGRPPKPKPAVDESAPPAAPKKRGRPPKPKPEGAASAAPKKRGRPPKKKSEPE